MKEVSWLAKYVPSLSSCRLLLFLSDLGDDEGHKQPPPTRRVGLERLAATCSVRLIETFHLLVPLLLRIFDCHHSWNNNNNRLLLLYRNGSASTRLVVAQKQKIESSPTALRVLPTHFYSIELL